MYNDRKDRERPEAYPKPSQTDQQWKGQHEFLEPEPNRNEEDFQVDNERGERDWSRASSATEENRDSQKGGE
ncbi:hypothetical protein V9K67_12180 [Paraflavisolibacter sp. H34]|uniref:hypothetical protein n=1 Tax=Huijunlia imazamoxiresistens TaxID=3127457 RepID=UPI00301A7D31